MAIIYKKGSKELKYTGIDKAFKGFGDTLEKIKSAPSRAIDGAINRSKKHNEMKRNKNRRLIERAFGSVENYNRFRRDID